MSVTSGATLVGSCGLERQTEKLIPYLVPPEDGIIPGEAVYVPTTCTECPAGCGVSVRVRESTPVKLEGLQGHPLNEGALCARGQASLERLFHPRRIHTPLRRNTQGGFDEISWDDAYRQLAGELAKSGGAASSTLKSNVYLSGRTTGTLSSLIERFCRSLNVERLPECELFCYGAIREANSMLFGEKRIPDYRIDEADFLLTLGADIFETFAAPVTNANRYGRRGKIKHAAWYHLEPHITLSGLQADHRYALRPGSEPFLLLYLIQRVSGADTTWLQTLPDISLEVVAAKTGLPANVIEDINEGLNRASNPLVIAGGVSTRHEAGLETAVFAALLQWRAGMIGRTVDFALSQDYASVGTLKDLDDVCERLQEGTVGVIFLSKMDPMSFGGEACNFSEAVQKASFRVGLSVLMNDTMRVCDLILPLSHPLESWGDATPRRGITTLIQPSVQPMFDTRMEGDILLDIMRIAAGEDIGRTFQNILFETWTRDLGAANVEAFIEKGFITRQQPTVPVQLNDSAAEAFARRMELRDPAAGIALVVAPSLRFFDGRSADLPLLSEIPDPVATVSYGSWLAVSTEDAAAGGWRDQDEVKVSSGEWTALLPVAIQPGLQSGVMMIQQGPDAIPLAADARSGEAICLLPQVSVERTGKTVAVPVLSGSTSQEGRGVIPHGDEHHHHPHGEHSNYPEPDYPQYRWAMAIDLDRCIGCSACVAACYVENNIPLTGKNEHLKGREMSWLRIEPYFEADSGVANRNNTHFLPMMCQQCDYAPCEPVCPVYAVYHNPEGLNAQVYNRCVGTRYCSNNCPYKVRRFNWFQHDREEQLDRIKNPDVSKRGKGMMEKCTFCIQRIRKAKDTAKDEKRGVRDGEIVPACAQTCPTQAIVFGNLLDESSTVYKWAHSPRAMRVFEHLGTSPGVYYLSRRGMKHEV
jgi:molybdopterin-containing oxidoreductase family iron-sulfur binding subunit